MATSMASEGAGRAGLVRRAAEGALGAATAFLAALQFLTIAPPLVRRPFTAAEMGHAVGFFPLVGVVIGGALAGLSLLLALAFPAAVVHVLLLAAWVLLTGALHVDGFLDACDGLWGGRTPEDRLRIFRDEHVGSYAVVAGVLLFLLKYAALGAAAESGALVPALILAPTLGRWGMAGVVIAFPYARTNGLGISFKDGVSWVQLMLATATAGVASWLVAGWIGIAAMLVAGLAAWLGALYVMRRLPGLTGDIYGAICETLEALALLGLIAGERLCA